MINSSPKILAVIPARGGSKSIPRKNIKLFGGYPLIAYSIAAGLKAKAVNRVILSTDDEEIAGVARGYGAEVPFLRPAELAQEQTQDLAVFEDLLTRLKKHEGYCPDLIVQLRPTSPLRPPGCVDEAVSLLLKDNRADSVRAVVPSGENPYKMWRIEDGYMVPLLDSEFSEHYNMPRQKLPATFWQTGHIDVIRYETIVKKHSMSGGIILPYILDSSYAIDIDNLQQWELGEWMLTHTNLEIVRGEDPPGLSHEKS